MGWGGGGEGEAVPVPRAELEDLDGALAGLPPQGCAQQPRGVDGVPQPDHEDVVGPGGQQFLLRGDRRPVMDGHAEGHEEGA